MQYLNPFFLLALICCTAASQAQTTFYTDDVARFYQAFDSVQTTADPAVQTRIVQQIYLDKGTAGVQYAIQHSLNGGQPATARNWVDMMANQREYLIRIRPFLSSLPAQMNTLRQKFVYFKSLYPEFKDGNVYFVMGLGMFGGRPEGNALFIGCELLASEQPDWAVSIVLHEFVHTLQRQSDNALLAHCLYEGAADFIAELVHQRPLSECYPNGYNAFGLKHEAAVWHEFKQFIPSDQPGRFFNWLYGATGRTINGVEMKDLGYFMGYAICKAYYVNAADKRQAISEIIEMDVSSNEKARTFLLQSGYAKGKDRRFVQTFQFARIDASGKRIKLRHYGYTLQRDQVVFRFELPPDVDVSKVEYVTIAGNFNGWTPNNPKYKMNPAGNRLYEFTMPRSVFSENHNEFKFVINGEQWQDVPFDARNTQHGNLTLDF